MMEDFEDGAAPPTVDLVQCHVCERSFFPESLAKHTNICNKIANKTRKPFDSRKQRTGSEASALEPKPEPPKKPNNWRKTHEEFIANMRGANMATAAMKRGEPLPPPPPPTYDPDYIQCPYCQRRFNETAAERHVKFCKEKHARMPNKGTPGEDKKPLAAVDQNTSITSSVPTAPSRLPQRSGVGQTYGNPVPKVFSEASERSTGLSSRPSAANMATAAMKRGEPVPPPPPPTYDPDYIQCPYCQRRFNETAAERHVKFCKEKHARMPNKGMSGEDKNPAGSMSYKPPAAVDTNTSITSSVPTAPSRLPQRSGVGQTYGNPVPKVFSEASERSTGLSSRPSAANMATAAMKRGEPVPPPPPPTYDPDYIQCPYCQRRFNETAAERHVKFCKEKHARMPNKGMSGEDKKPPAAVDTNTSITSSVPTAPSRLPQRSGVGQTYGNPVPKVFSEASERSAGLSSRPSAANMATAAMKAGGPVPNKGMSGEDKNPPGSTSNKPPAAVDQNASITSSVPTAPSRSPQRSGVGQKSGIPAPKVFYTGSVRSAGLSSRPSGATTKPQVLSSGYGSVRKTDPGTSLRKKNAEASVSRRNGNMANNVSECCRSCGTRYPVQSAKFCYECGVRRMWTGQDLRRTQLMAPHPGFSRKNVF